MRAITDLARSLGISIIAEGAETEAELECLKSLGCDQVQGFYYSTAVDAAGAAGFMALLERAPEPEAAEQP